MQVLKLSEYVRRCLVIQGTWIPASLEGKPDIDLYDPEQLGEPSLVSMRTSRQTDQSSVRQVAANPGLS